MSTRHSTDAAPSVNSDFGIPTEGRFTAEQFAAFFGHDGTTIRKWLQKYKIPHFKPGSMIIVDAATFWSHIPMVAAGDEE